MTVTLNLPPQIERAYIAEAQARGLAVDEILSQVLVAARPDIGLTKLSPDEWMLAFRAWSEAPAHAGLPDLPDEAISRESIYAERGL